MAIDFSQVKEVKYNSQDVTKIERSGVTLWQKVVDPTADLLTLNGYAPTYSGSSGAINVRARELSDQSYTKYKVYWKIRGTSSNNLIDTSTDKIVFPYKKGSASTAALSKISIGTVRANSSGTISTSSAVNGIEFYNEMDMSSYKGLNNDYYGEFEVTPGSSSTYNVKAVGFIQLESLYPIAGGSMLTANSFNNTIDSGYMLIDNEYVLIQSSSNKLLMLGYEFSDGNYYQVYVAVKPVS